MEEKPSNAPNVYSYQDMRDMFAAKFKKYTEDESLHIADCPVTKSL